MRSVPPRRSYKNSVYEIQIISPFLTSEGVLCFLRVVPGFGYSVKMEYAKICLLLVLPALASCAVTGFASQDNEVVWRARSADSEDKGGLKVFAKVLEDCNSEDYSKIASCLGVKTIVALDRAARAGSIDLISGVKLVKTEDAESLRNGRSLTEEDIQNSIDAEPTERSSRLLDLLFESATKFLQSHSLEFKFPQTSPQELQRAFEEGTFPFCVLIPRESFCNIG